MTFTQFSFVILSRAMMLKKKKKLMMTAPLWGNYYCQRKLINLQVDYITVSYHSIAGTVITFATGFVFLLSEWYSCMLSMNVSFDVVSHYHHENEMTFPFERQNTNKITSFDYLYDRDKRMYTNPIIIHRKHHIWYSCFSDKNKIRFFFFCTLVWINR